VSPVSPVAGPSTGGLGAMGLSLGPMRMLKEREDDGPCKCVSNVSYFLLFFFFF
jgi:hypothetical protein